MNSLHADKVQFKRQVKEAEIELKKAREKVKKAMAEVEACKALLFSLKYEKAFSRSNKNSRARDALGDGWPEGFYKLPNMVKVGIAIDCGFSSFEMLKKAVESGFDPARIPNTGNVNRFMVKKLLKENGVIFK